MLQDLKINIEFLKIQYVILKKREDLVLNHYMICLENFFVGLWWNFRTSNLLCGFPFCEINITRKCILIWLMDWELHMSREK